MSWAEVAMVSDIGDSHELNDDRCLVLTSRDLDQQAKAVPNEFMLCLLADGATGSTFADETSTQAGWRASQLAQAAFVERFLASVEVDMLDRLKDGLRAADRALVHSTEGSLSTTLTALYLAADGAAYAASIGDSVLLVLPPTRRTPADRRLKKLGYEDTTAVGSGDTTLSYVDESELIEQWWPNKEAAPLEMRVKPGTYFVLLSDGISDNLPIDVIDRLVHRHALDSATVGLPRYTRERRAEAQKSGGGSTNQLGLDNMSAIVVRFDGARQPGGAAPQRLEAARLFTVVGTHGGPEPASGGHFGLLALAGQQNSATLMPGFLRAYLESEHAVTPDDRLAAAYLASMPDQKQARFAVLARDASGSTRAFSAGLPDLTSLFDVGIDARRVAAARDTVLQRFAYSPRLWASSLAALALLLLVSTAFATGTVRPAPPPVSTPVPGQPTPTPDTRPQLSLGGFVLVGPPAAAPTPAPPAPAEATVEVLSVEIEAAPTETAAEVEPPRRTQPVRPAPAPVQRGPVCNNLFGIGCPSGPPPPPAQRSDTDVIPVASPAARSSGGTNLDEALQIASIADQRFARGLTHPAPEATPAPISP